LTGRPGLWLIALALGGCDRPGAEPASVRPPATAPVQADSDAYAMLIARDVRGGPALPSKGAIIGGDWLYDTPTGAGWFAARLPAPETAAGTRRYRLERLQLTIEPGACADPRLRAAFPDRVTVTGGDQNHSGCGGPRVTSADVRGTHWQVVQLAGKAAPAGGAPTVFTFAEDGRVGGSLACNDVGIGARWTDNGFQHPSGQPFIEGTAVGCQGPDVHFGNRFWSAMHQAVSWHREGTRLRIRFADRTDAELRLIL
jgi:heat shock protein HslJ